MDVTKFNEKFNRVDGKIYVVEEVVTPVGGLYEAELTHDNINNLNVYTGSKLTGTKITTYSTSTPSLTPWKTIIKIFSTEPQLFITYETTGDQVEAEDINNLQDAINLTQEELNKETNRATSRENNIEKNLNSEITRAKSAESTENTRAINRENLIEKNLDLEVERAKASEKVLTDNLNTEINRAKGSEKTISDNLSSEVNRATNVESTMTNNLNKEIDRAKAKENSVEDNINNYKTTNNAEIQGLKAKDIDLDNKKANLDYVNLELNKRYTKDQTFTRDEVLKKIQDLIGTAPDTLDTFKEIADALGNDPNFATTIMNELSSKVDKVVGKSLSTNDYDNTEKTKLADVNAKKHEHSNKSIIDKITQGLLDAWNSAYSHISDSIRHITSSERNLWNTVSDKANKIDIPNKLSQLTNDKKFITQDDIDTSQNHIHNNKSVLDKISQETLDDINLSADKVLKNKLTPIEINSTLTKLDNCTGGYVRNMLLKGKTLQNILDESSPFGYANAVIENFDVTKDKSSIKFVCKKSGLYNAWTHKVLNRNLLKVEETYTIFCLDEGLFPIQDISVKVMENPSTMLIARKVKHGVFKFKFTEELSNTSGEIKIVAETRDKDYKVGDTQKNSNWVVLEGDFTKENYFDYFEEIKSVGELEGNKISILTCGKNLFDINSRAYSTSGKIKNIINNTITLEQSADNKRMAFVAFYLKLKPNTSYSLSGKLLSDNTCLRIYNLEDDTSYCTLESTGNVTFHTNNDTELQLLLYTAWASNENKGKIATFETIQVEEGTTTTTYEPYKTDKTEILTGTEPLRGLPNGASDIVDFDKNERIKNVGKVVLNGSENWWGGGSKKNKTICFNYVSSEFAKIIMSEVGIISYPLRGDSCWNTWSSEDMEGVSLGNNGNYIQVNIFKTNLLSYGFKDVDSSTHLQAFKAYSKDHQLEVYYQLANPIVEKLDIKDTLQTFTDGYIQLDNSITPVTQLEYSTNLPSGLSGVVEIQDKLIDRVNTLEKRKPITWNELEGI